MRKRARTVTGTSPRAIQNLLVEAKLLVEAADTATGVHHLLLAGEEGVALGANLHADILLGGASLDHIPAGAGDGGVLVIGMNTLLHVVHLFLVSG